jgi:hypothetical protein
MYDSNFLLIPKKVKKKFPLSYLYFHRLYHLIHIEYSIDRVYSKDIDQVFVVFDHNH